MNLCGVDFSASATDVDAQVTSGPLVHTVLEWSAFCAAVFTVVLAFGLYSIRKEAVLPIIGTALFCAGAMDAVTILAAGHLIDGMSLASNSIPFTWTISRTFNALTLIVSSLILLARNPTKSRNPIGFLVLVCVFFALASYGVINACTNAGVLPDAVNPGSFVKRPYDLLPLALFVTWAVAIYPSFARRSPGPLSRALLLAIIPQVREAASHGARLNRVV